MAEKQKLTDELKQHARDAAWRWYLERTALDSDMEPRERWAGTMLRIIEAAREALNAVWELFDDEEYADTFVAALMNYKSADVAPKN